MPHCNGKVLQVQRCRVWDPVFTLLNSYLPLVLLIYSISFKLNNFSEYFRTMIRIWIMFTCLQCWPYNKAPLIWINMCSHKGKHAPQLYNLLRNYIAIFDEYPVENTQLAYSVHRQKVLILLMNLERKQSLFSSQRVNNHTTGHFSPHLSSFLSHTTNFAY